MGSVVICAYELACSAAPAFIVFLIMRRSLVGRIGDAGAPSVALGAVLSIYLFCLLRVTGAGTVHDALRFGVELNPTQLNLLPLVGLADDAAGFALNVLLFAPFGALAFLFSGKSLGTLPAAMTAAVASAVIEVSQLLNSRVTDVDDLLMNVAGFLVGYMAFAAACGRRPGKQPGLCIAASMAAAAFVARFLIYDEMGAAKALFGF